LRHLGLAEEISRRVTIIAASKSHQLFAAIELRVGVSRFQQGGVRRDGGCDRKHNPS
jgi:hypothetical protein